MRTPQQSPSLVQPSSSPAQPQRLLTHWSEQHSDGSSQGLPSSVQVAAQRPLDGSHSRVPQQSALDWQASPSAWHWHVNDVVSQRSAPQQSESVLHVPPDSLHAHRLLVGSHSSAPQQSPLDVQPSPATAQPHVPSTQSSEQHWSAELHVMPSSRQAPPASDAPGV